MTVVPNANGRHRAVLVDGGTPNRPEPTLRESAEPALPVLVAEGRGPLRALLVSNAATEYSDGLREGQEPALAVTGESGGRVRAVLVDSAGYADETGQRAPVTAPADAPAGTILANHGRRGLKALLISGANTSEEQAAPGVGCSCVDEPARCVNATNTQHTRALVGVRCVKLSPRCLARFQSVPDTYRLPAKTALACRVLGNGVPCLLAQRIMESLR